MDVLGRHSCVNQLAAIGLDQIQKDVCRQFAVAGSTGSEKQERILIAHGVGFFHFVEKIGGVGELGFKALSHFLADLITATVNARADGSFDVPWLGTKATAHLTDAFFDDPLNRTAPSGVKNANCTAFGVDENNGQAVCRLDGEQNFWYVSDQAIANELVLR